jgi:two-component system, OmpR family, response regulator
VSFAVDTFPTPQILVVDDDDDLRESMAAYLGQHGYRVQTASDALTMDAALASAPIDLIVLDVMMRGEDGLSICRRLREAGGPAIVMVSAMGEEIDRVLGLELGADDYLPKPCSPRELLARIRAVLRRGDERSVGAAIRSKAYYFLGFTLDGVRRQLRAPNGLTILLTAGELSLLNVFLENPQRILSRDELIGKARGGDSEVFDRAIDVQISRLRRKLHDCTPQEIIKTYRGAGYLFDARVTRP